MPGTADQAVQTLALPAGSWVVTAKFIAENATPTGTLACSLNIGGVPVDTLGPFPGIDFDQGRARTR